MRPRHSRGRSCKFGSGTLSRIATGTVISASTCGCQDGEAGIEHPSATDKFIAAYNAAISEHVSAPRQAGAAKTGSFRHAFACFILPLPRSSASIRRHNHGGAGRVASMCEKHADKPVALMEARHVRALRDERSDRPGAANTRLKALKALFAWACEEKPDFGPAKSNVRSAQDQVRNGRPPFHEFLAKSRNIAIDTRLAARHASHLTCCSTRAAVVRMPFDLVRSTCAMAGSNSGRRRTRIRNPIDIDIPLHCELRSALRRRRPDT